MRIVMKFGGTSISERDKIDNVVKIVKDYKKQNEMVIVVSAMKGVTDRLIDIANKTAQSEVSEEEIKNFVGDIKEKHMRIAKDVVKEDELDRVLIEIGKFSNELEKALTGILYVGELTPRSLDYVMSFGERLSAAIISGAFNKENLNSRWLTGFESGITTNSDFGKAVPLWDVTDEKISTVLELLLKDSVPVVTGFIAGDTHGRITTLGREGSDYTAAIIGSALNADEIWIWTDVDGIMTTDPKIVEEARVIPVMSYTEAIELAFFGAKVLHPKALEPALEKGVPVRVKNTFNPEGQGTLIVKEQEKSDQIVKAVSVMSDVSLVNVSGTGMIGVPGIAARIFGTLGKANVNILMISQASSEVNISIMVGKSDFDAAIEAIEDEFEGTRIVKSLNHEEDVSIIAVVGAGMRGTKGVAAKIFTAVANADVNILMIAQGSSEVNVSFVVSSKDAKKAAKALHDEFELAEVS
ncbi:MAG: aspartate kinase [Candidatus Hydrothermarchaeales archaeon]